MQEATNLAPLSGCKRNFMHQPVVALRLPPANFLNRFTVNRKKHRDHKRWAWFHSFPPRALDLSLTQFFPAIGGPALSIFPPCLRIVWLNLNPRHPHARLHACPSRIRYRQSVAAKGTSEHPVSQSLVFLIPEHLPIEEAASELCRHRSW